jgi:GT2 family glycosyltransferase
MAAGERALNDHLKRRGTPAKADLIGLGFKIKYEIPKNSPLVSLVIPTRNGLSLIRSCIDSIIQKTTYSNYEIIIVDNGSDQLEVLQYFDEVVTNPKIRVIREDAPFNYSALNNKAVSLARGEVVGLINNDIEVISPDWLAEMVSIAIQPSVGAVGAKLLYSNGTIQHAGIILGIGGWAGSSHAGFERSHPGYLGRLQLISTFSAVTGACLIIEKSKFIKVGGLNERELQIACNDVELCLKLRDLGYRNVWTPFAELYHHESASRGFDDTPEKISRFNQEVEYVKSRWPRLFTNDPAYSPNLTLDAGNFRLASPPRLTNKKKYKC